MSHVLFVQNKVVKGFGRGSKELGCPTANVDGANSVGLETGIYCGLAQLVIRKPDEIQEEPGCKGQFEDILKQLPYTSSVMPMVCSFGYNPQYGNKDKSLEVHVIDNIEFNFYGAELRVLICKKMRDEEKYNSLDELKQAIANDIRNAKRELPNFEKHALNRNYFLNINENNNNHYHHDSENDVGQQ